MAVYTNEYESQPEAILTNVIVCPAVDITANVAVPVHCQVENVLWDTGATNTLISHKVVDALGSVTYAPVFFTPIRGVVLCKIFENRAK